MHKITVWQCNSDDIKMISEKFQSKSNQTGFHAGNGEIRPIKVSVVGNKVI